MSYWRSRTHTLMSRRFDTLEELLDFEIALGNLPQKAVQTPDVIDEEPNDLDVEFGMG